MAPTTPLTEDSSVADGGRSAAEGRVVSSANVAEPVVRPNWIGMTTATRS